MLTVAKVCIGVIVPVMSTTCKLQLLPVHNDQEGVEAMLTVAKVCIGVIVPVMSTTCKLQLLPVHNDQ